METEHVCQCICCYSETFASIPVDRQNDGHISKDFTPYHIQQDIVNTNFIYLNGEMVSWLGVSALMQGENGWVRRYTVADLPEQKYDNFTAIEVNCAHHICRQCFGAACEEILRGNVELRDADSKS